MNRTYPLRAAEVDDVGVEFENVVLRPLAERLCLVDGVVGVTLGGSRARGTHTTDSDYDVGIYYRGILDTDALTGLAQECAGAGASATRTGEWGPWVDGGAWLSIDGTAVDWLYRDLDRVIAVWQDTQQGVYGFHAQTGHPFGFADIAYPGELAPAVILADPSGRLAALRAEVRHYPDPLRDALVGRLWEAEFVTVLARKAISRADATYVAGCLFRALCLCAHALHAHARRWLINEKGAVAEAGALPNAPADFTVRAHAVLGRLGTTPEELTAAVTLAEQLVEDTRSVCPLS
ncbi:nucleotidyltransferase domain-containing protein [Rhodococcus sp. 4CII]|uniref:nucleotidyltransferase domain-containing protein n=2 Tax=unclassified Rhodococcus (in: high G+C Gram-positive bacteria) TaxID=192944 RepID=UPI00163AA857|nr:nucleotidyltransferase domain-containing protein [Rhodococcus sp. 4CII]MBC2640574.1 nucleotidyltransferase domain-containing protein [Rhodococcus sp. 3A]MBC2894680.1 nucleotidyltransferase domain-containing protein [Rhodococcus sp. 4CII]